MMQAFWTFFSFKNKSLSDLHNVKLIFLDLFLKTYMASPGSTVVEHANTDHEVKGWNPVPLQHQWPVL
jgi:hypothetical protein